MPTKVYGVDMEVLQKLYQFQFLLKKRKFGIVDKTVDFLAFVQVQSEKEPIPEIKQISVAHTTILIEETSISIAKYKMDKIETNAESNQVVIRFKKPFWGIGKFISFDFKTPIEKNDFLAAVGGIENDESNIQEITSPSSEDSD
ncbi:hypothetical protein Zmor_012923 [Zophobas morio]|uniref:Uncharacterized protein n=1 Tax=Zophobas morio TaxID=2755281 RepID=A0AA38IC62_9CUCU|nr:hypothetical protein Zmor_012923 [Zophobas morio]